MKPLWIITEEVKVHLSFRFQIIYFCLARYSETIDGKEKPVGPEFIRNSLMPASQLDLR
jgi:hypothetical protein